MSIFLDIMISSNLLILTAPAKDAVGKAAHESGVESILRLQSSHHCIGNALVFNILRILMRRKITGGNNIEAQALTYTKKHGCPMHWPGSHDHDKRDTR